MPKNRRHDGWVLDEQDPSLYKGLDPEARDYLEKFNQAWAYGPARDLGKLEPETEGEQSVVNTHRHRRRKDALNLAKRSTRDYERNGSPSLLDIAAQRNSPEQALIEAVDARRNPIRAYLRVMAADDAAAKRRRKTELQRIYRFKAALAKTG